MRCIRFWSGYLENRVPPAGYRYVGVLAIPNREVRSIYRSEILSRMNPGRTTSYLMTTMENGLPCVNLSQKRPVAEGKL